MARRSASPSSGATKDSACWASARMANGIGTSALTSVLDGHEDKSTSIAEGSPTLSVASVPLGSSDTNASVRPSGSKPPPQLNDVGSTEQSASRWYWPDPDHEPGVGDAHRT